jgi:hypothetical protein
MLSLGPGCGAATVEKQVSSPAASKEALAWYGIRRVPADDLETVAHNLGGTVVEMAVENQTADQIKTLLDQAGAVGYGVILNLYARETRTKRPWDWNGSEWVFPPSTVETLQEIAHHPALFAVYALHEPLDAGEGYVSVAQQRELYQLLKQYTDGLPVFSDLGGLRVFEERGVELGDGLCDLCCTFPSYFNSDWTSEQCLAETLSRIDADLDTQQRLMPNSQIVFLINTYSYPGYQSYPIRMPTPEELAIVRDYVCDLDQPLMYYPWVHSAVDLTLKDAPELWPIIADGCAPAIYLPLIQARWGGQ